MEHNDIYRCILDKLDSESAVYERYEHAPVRTSEEAAALRGTRMEAGAKALVCHVDKSRYILAVLAAHRQVDFAVLRKQLAAKKLALASPEEVLRETRCEVGGVPPFGSCIGLPTFVDPSLAANEHIAFNAGLRTHSIVMRYTDWERIEQPTVCSFAKHL